MNTLNQLLEQIQGASFISLTTESSVKLTGGKQNPLQGRVTKRTVGSNVMVFTNAKSNGYANMVMRRLEAEGKDPQSFQLQPRKWGVRIPGTPIVEHNEQQYLEVIFLKSGKTTYYVDGIETPRELIIGLTEQEEAEQGGLDNKVIIRTYSFASVKQITINKATYDVAMV